MPRRASAAAGVDRRSRHRQAGVSSMSAFITTKAGEVATTLGAGFRGRRKLRCALDTADSYAQQGVERLPILPDRAATATRTAIEIARAPTHSPARRSRTGPRAIEDRSRDPSAGITRKRTPLDESRAAPATRKRNRMTRDLAFARRAKGRAIACVALPYLDTDRRARRARIRGASWAVPAFLASVRRSCGRSAVAGL